jgi:tetratricopeptide (TPR) repeat protein
VRVTPGSQARQDLPPWRALAWAGLGLFGAGLVAWVWSRGERSPGPWPGSKLARALAEGREGEVEASLHLAIREAGRAASAIARVQLVELLLALSREEEARTVAATAGEVPATAGALHALSRAELAVLTRRPDDALLQEIVADRHSAIHRMEGQVREVLQGLWGGVIGVCLVRMGRHAEALGLLESAVLVVDRRPTQIVYAFHLALARERVGDLIGARLDYERAARVFPTSPWAAKARAALARL